MSVDISVFYGYGVCVSDAKSINLQGLKLLLSMAPETNGDIQKYFDEQDITNPEIEDYDEYDTDYYIGIPVIVANAINEIEGTQNFSAIDDGNGNVYVLLTEQMPYHYNDKEKSLTEEDVEDILRKHISLCYEGEFRIEYQTIEQMS